MSRRKVGLVVFTAGALASSLILVDFILMGMTLTQGLWAAILWVLSIGLFFVGFEVLTRKK